MAIVPVPPLADIPHFPALSERATGTYNASAYAFGTHMADTFNAELDAVAENVVHNAGEAAASAVASAASAVASAGSAAAAAIARDATFNAANFKGDWATLTGALNLPASVRHNGRFWLLVANVADVAAAVPGVSASWTPLDAASLPLVHVTTTTHTAAPGSHCSLENAAATTITLPASPLDGDVVWVTVNNGRTDNVLARNGTQIMGVAEDMTLDVVMTYQLRFINTSWRLL